MFRLAAKYGNGWIPNKLPAGDYATLKEIFSKELPRIRDPTNFTWALHDSSRPPELNSTNLVKRIEECASAGCEYYAIAWNYEKDESLRRVNWFSKDVLSSFK
jgi:hypothetical protein